MSESMAYLLLADLILVLHFLFIVFVVVGLVLIVTGLIRGWRWVRSFWFRVAHVAAIGVVVAQAWGGVICPLTVWENNLRLLGGGAGYEGSFIQHWLHRIMFFESEPWVFAVAYTLFGGLVILTWVWGPPAWPGKIFRRGHHVNQ